MSSTKDLDTNTSQADSSKNFFSTLSRAFQTFFSQFLWRIIYTIKMKDYEYLNEDEILKEFIDEVTKVKLRESFYRGRRIKFSSEDFNSNYCRDIEVKCNK